jgi:hypothetical protein
MISRYGTLQALVFTDNSNKYPIWPASPNKSLRGETNFQLAQNRKTSPLISSKPNQEIRQSMRTKTSAYESRPQSGGHSTSPQKSPSYQRSPRSSIDNQQLRQQTLSKLNQMISSTNSLRLNTDFHTMEPRHHIPTPIAQSKPQHDSTKISPTKPSGASRIEPSRKSVSSLLSAAESLLNNVKSKANRTKELSSSQFAAPSHHSKSLSSKIASHILPPNLNKAHDKLQDIELLLRGLPEAYDEDDPELDDDYIDRLLSEGGKPPSQLSFPSIYASNQRLMQKLQSCDRIEITLSHLSVGHWKYGIRRDASSIVIRPPSGCRGYPATIPLTELKSYQLMTKADKRNKLSMNEYFAGSIDLHHRVSYPLTITDEIIQDWMMVQSSDKSCVRIELHSSLYPLNAIIHARNKSKAKTKALGISMCFAYVDIPLQGLLSSEYLDSIVTCQMTAVAMTFSSVMDRWVSLYSQSKSTQLSMKMGTITARITLSHSSASTSATGKPSVESKTGKPMPMNQLPPMSIDKTSVAAPIDNIHAALEFIPSEPKTSATISALADDRSGNLSTSLDLCFGVVLHQARFVSLLNDMSNVLLTYKDPHRNKHQISLSSIQSQKYYPLNHHSIHHYSPTLSPYPMLILELWSTSSTTPRLLGLAKFSPTNNYNEIVWLEILSIATKQSLGEIACSLHLDEAEAVVVESMRRLSESFQLLSEKCEDNALIADAKSSTIPPLPLNQANSISSALADSAPKDDSVVDADIDETLSYPFNSGADYVAELPMTEEKQIVPFNSEPSEEQPSAQYSFIEADADGGAEDVPLPEALPEHDAFDAAPALEPDDHEAIKSSQEEEQTQIHVLDLQVDGCSLKPSHSNASSGVLGLQVYYSLPKQSLVSSDTSTSSSIPSPILPFNDSEDVFYDLWWDAECAILNSRHSHRLKSLSGLQLLVHPEGGSLLGTAVLTKDMLFDIFQQAGCYRSLTLPIDWKDEHERSSLFANMQRYLTINISHRLEPRLLHPTEPRTIFPSLLIPSTELLVEDVPVYLSDRPPSTPMDEEGSKLNVHIEQLIHLDFSSGRIYQSDRSSEESSLEVYLVAEMVSSSKASQFVSKKKLILLDQHRDVRWDEQLSIPTDIPDDLRSYRDAVLRIALCLSLPYALGLNDEVLGVADIDLSMLAYDGIPYLEGWYHLYAARLTKRSSTIDPPAHADDAYHDKSIGQIKVKVLSSNRDNYTTAAADVEVDDMDQDELFLKDGEDIIDGDGHRERDDEQLFDHLRSLLQDLETTKQELLSKFSTQQDEATNSPDVHSNDVASSKIDPTFQESSAVAEGVQALLDDDSAISHLTYESLEESDSPMMDEPQQSSSASSSLSSDLEFSRAAYEDPRYITISENNIHNNVADDEDSWDMIGISKEDYWKVDDLVPLARSSSDQQTGLEADYHATVAMAAEESRDDLSSGSSTSAELSTSQQEESTMSEHVDKDLVGVDEMDDHVICSVSQESSIKGEDHAATDIQDASPVHDAANLANSSQLQQSSQDLVAEREVQWPNAVDQDIIDVVDRTAAASIAAYVDDSIFSDDADDIVIPVARAVNVSLSDNISQSLQLADSNTVNSSADEPDIISRAILEKRPLDLFEDVSQSASSDSESSIAHSHDAEEPITIYDAQLDRPSPTAESDERYSSSFEEEELSIPDEQASFSPSAAAYATSSSSSGSNEEKYADGSWEEEQDEMRKLHELPPVDRRLLKEKIAEPPTAVSSDAPMDIVTSTSIISAAASVQEDEVTERKNEVVAVASPPLMNDDRVRELIDEAINRRQADELPIASPYSSSSTAPVINIRPPDIAMLRVTASSQEPPVLASSSKKVTSTMPRLIDQQVQRLREEALHRQQQQQRARGLASQPTTATAIASYQHKKFLEQETARISRIMLGSDHHSHSSKP